MDDVGGKMKQAKDWGSEKPHKLKTQPEKVKIG